MKKPAPKKTKSAPSAASLIAAKIKSLGDWRGKTFARLRKIIRAADPGLVEEVKWRKPSNPLGVALWSHDGMICTGETYKDTVKLHSSPTARRLVTRRAFSTRASKIAVRGAPSMSTRATRSTTRR